MWNNLAYFLGQEVCGPKSKTFVVASNIQSRVVVSAKHWQPCSDFFLIFFSAGIRRKLSCLCHCSKPDGCFCLAKCKGTPLQGLSHGGRDACFHCATCSYTHFNHFTYFSIRMTRTDIVLCHSSQPYGCFDILEGKLLERIQTFHKRRLLPPQFQLLQLLQPPHQLLHPDAFDWHRFRSFTTLLIPVRDPLPLPLSLLFPPATLTSSRETGSLLARAPLDCRAAAVCEQAAIASKGRTHQVLRLVAWQCEDSYHSPWRVPPSSFEPFGDFFPPGSSWVWQGPPSGLPGDRGSFSFSTSSSRYIYPSSWYDQAVTDPAGRQRASLLPCIYFFALGTFLPCALGSLSPLPSELALCWRCKKVSFPPESQFLRC